MALMFTDVDPRGSSLGFDLQLPLQEDTDMITYMQLSFCLSEIQASSYWLVGVSILHFPE